MGPASYDVVISGAGPAGCAAAITLADYAPDLRICLIDAGHGGARKAGDTVPPLIAPILRHLGLWPTFLSSGHKPAHRSVSAWGALHIATNEYFFLGSDTAWQLDRRVFEQSLTEAAAARLSRFETGVIAGCRQTGGCLTVTLKSGAVLTARYAIDATGRAAALSRMMTASPVIFDRLVGCLAFAPDSQTERNELLIESFEAGWWYTACLPRGRRVVACMTDAEQIRPLGLRSAEGFRARLANTRYVEAVTNGDGPLDGPHVLAANSRLTEAQPGLPLLPAGDAAFATDPICGQGIVNALRGGVYAAYAVADWLLREDPKGLDRYRAWVHASFASYQMVLRDFYAVEARWPDHPFWRRRQTARLVPAPEGIRQ